jgi:hypothetical protein
MKKINNKKKTISKDNYNLKSCFEIIGILKNIKKFNHSLRLYFEIEKMIDIPRNSFDENYIRKLTGKKIGILNIDGKYNIRLIERDTNNNSEINKKTSSTLDNNLYKKISNEIDDFLKNLILLGG